MITKLRFRGDYSHFIFIAFLFILAPLSAQQRENIFIAPITEVNGYGWNSAAYGGGLTIGAGTGGALGLNLLYAADSEYFSFMEIQFFARAYIYGKNAYSGPFVQIGLGPVIYTDISPEAGAGDQNEGYGSFSAGLTAGWRFLTGRFIYIEPAVRLGYPYLAGVSLSIGAQMNTSRRSEQRPLSEKRNEE